MPLPRTGELWFTRRSRNGQALRRVRCTFRYPAEPGKALGELKRVAYVDDDEPAIVLDEPGFVLVQVLLPIGVVWVRLSNLTREH